MDYDIVRYVKEEEITKFGEWEIRVPIMKISSFDGLIESHEGYAEYHGAFKDKPDRGLAEYIHLFWGDRKIPITVFDNHMHAFYVWCLALKNKNIKKGATLIHIDSHEDSGKADNFDVNIHKLNDVYAYTLNHLSSTNFISPAFSSGLISNFLNINPLSEADKYVFIKEDYITRNVPFTSTGLDSNIIDRILAGQIKPENLILDIDIDYFIPHKTHIWPYSWSLSKRNAASTDELLTRDIKRIRELAQRVGVVSVATSPGYIDLNISIDLIKKIFN